MPTFTYVATDLGGKRSSGTVRGSSAAGVTESLVTQGYEVQHVKPKKTSVLDFEITAKRVDRVELGNFSRQMGAFIKAGVPILDALDIIQSETKDKKLREVLTDVRDSLRFGESFATAMGDHSKALPSFYVAMLRSAEATGDLDVVMGELARYIERDTESRRTVRSALVYPSLVLALALVTVLVMVAFVLPRFETFFDSFDATLPLATRILLGVTRFITDWYIVILGALLAVGVLGFIALRTPKGRELTQSVLLRTPALGPVLRHMAIERFCRILSSTIKAGVPMPEALDLAGDGAQNIIYRKAVARARLEMLEGGGISAPMARTGLFPRTVTQMIRVGEETGTLDEQLDNVAGFYGSELTYRIKRLTGLFEPTIIVGVGIVVGFVAIAMISAIYGIYNQVDV